MVQKEIISIHIGQCGIQVGTAVWELFLIEHNINIEGNLIFPSPDIESCKTFFVEAINQRYVPRAMLIDSESGVIEEIKTGVFRTLFNPNYLISGLDDGANNFARGSFCLGNKLLIGALNTIRRLVEDCDELQGFILNHSISGGTGSGLTSVLLHALNMDYIKKCKIQIPILPGINLSTSVVDPYNSILHIHSSIDSSDLSFLIENQRLYEMCKRLLLVSSPYYIHINRIIAVIMSSLTCSMRFPGPFQLDLMDIGTNLVPYPRIHFPVIAHAPIVDELRQAYEIHDLNTLIKEVFSKENLTVNNNLSRGTYISIMLNARGDIASTNIGPVALNMKIKNGVKFVEWSPKGFKISLNSSMPATVPGSGMGFSNSSLTMLCNNTIIKDMWTELGRKFDLLFIRRAYLHWYIEEGMEETEFMEARLDLAMLWEDYEEISMSSAQIERELSGKPSRPLRLDSTDSDLLNSEDK